MTMVLSGTSGGIGVIGSGTAVASTSGTSIDFTGLPAGLKRITVMFSGVSTSGSSNHLIQIGAGSVTTTGYLSGSAWADNSNTTRASSSTAGFVVSNVSASTVKYGQIVLTNLSGNTWVAAHSGAFSDSAVGFMGGGGITLSGALDRVRITTVNGTDTFDAGSINILYE